MTQKQPNPSYNWKLCFTYHFFMIDGWGSKGRYWTKSYWCWSWSRHLWYFNAPYKEYCDRYLISTSHLKTDPSYSFYLTVPIEFVYRICTSHDQYDVSNTWLLSTYPSRAHEVIVVFGGVHCSFLYVLQALFVFFRVTPF